MTSLTNTCQLCQSSEDDEILYGELLTTDDVTVHYFCLLFGPALYQRGEDSEGIRGFLLPDIRKEIKRVEPLVCKFCRKKHANLGCSVRSCPFSYHLKCGRLNSVSFEFKNHFPTYCKKHKKFNLKKQLKRGDICNICFEVIDKEMPHILIPCCKNSWFHQECLQKFANSAGVFFKCPLCNDKTKCLDDLPRQGIFIPEKDADWELENNAFDDFLEESDKVCDSENCLVTDATLYEGDQLLWKFCSTCGASASHEICLSNPGSDFVCRFCTEILNRPKIQEPSQDKEPSPKKSQSPTKQTTFKNFNSWFSDDELVLSDEDNDKKPENVPNKRRYNLRSQSVRTSADRSYDFCADIKPSLGLCDDESSEEEIEKENEIQRSNIEEDSSPQSKRKTFVPLFSDDEEVLSDDELQSHLTLSFNKRKADESFTSTSSSENAFQRSKLRKTKYLFQ